MFGNSGCIMLPLWFRLEPAEGQNRILHNSNLFYHSLIIVSFSFKGKMTNKHLKEERSISAAPNFLGIWDWFRVERLFCGPEGLWFCMLLASHEWDFPYLCGLVAGMSQPSVGPQTGVWEQW